MAVPLTQNITLAPYLNRIDAKPDQLRTDKTGTELAFHPSPVYKNAAAGGGTYPDARHYWVRMAAVYPG